ncbi:MAG: GGDEF domain-containing protein [Nitrospirae bacterium]|nr:GGDEF domain-containing protein [Nitrospirota bacterium]
MKIKRLETEAAIDPLTKCYNRRAFDNYIEHDIANAERYDGDLSAVIYDLDHFKVINDTYGHPAGDMVLKEIACMVSSSIRKCDYIARYGGEEFALVLPDTKFFNAIDLAEKLRNKIEHHRMFLNDKQIKVTASFGVATLKRGSDKNRFLQEADEMLYRAKSAGRNKVMPNLKNCISSIKAFDRALRLLPPVMAESHTGRISLMKKH